MMILNMYSCLEKDGQLIDWVVAWGINRANAKERAGNGVVFACLWMCT